MEWKLIAAEQRFRNQRSELGERKRGVAHGEPSLTHPPGYRYALLSTSVLLRDDRRENFATPVAREVIEQQIADSYFDVNRDTHTAFLESDAGKRWKRITGRSSLAVDLSTNSGTSAASSTSTRPPVNATVPVTTQGCDHETVGDSLLNCS